LNIYQSWTLCFLERPSTDAINETAWHVHIYPGNIRPSWTALGIQALGESWITGNVGVVRNLSRRKKVEEWDGQAIKESLLACISTYLELQNSLLYIAPFFLPFFQRSRPSVPPLAVWPISQLILPTRRGERKRDGSKWKALETPCLSSTAWMQPAACSLQPADYS
jgi:hypothetical protein